MTRYTPDHDEATLAAVAALPKVELHLHLEGAAPPDFHTKAGAADPSLT